MPTGSAITLIDLGFVWPDGTVALDGLTASLPVGRTGLVGDNGSGKSTLLRVLAGELTPSLKVNFRASDRNSGFLRYTRFTNDQPGAGGVVGTQNLVKAVNYQVIRYPNISASCVTLYLVLV